MIDHDRKRNSNREALNQLKKAQGNQHNYTQVIEANDNTTDNKTWAFFGDLFIKLPTENVKTMIEKGNQHNKILESALIVVMDRPKSTG